MRSAHSLFTRNRRKTTHRSRVFFALQAFPEKDILEKQQLHCFFNSPYHKNGRLSRGRPLLRILLYYLSANFVFYFLQKTCGNVFSAKPKRKPDRKRECGDQARQHGLNERGGNAQL